MTDTDYKATDFEGKTIQRAYVSNVKGGTAGDYGYVSSITMEFADGTTMQICPNWQNDDSASLSFYRISPVPPTKLLD
jgi:hypothetical protein